MIILTGASIVDVCKPGSSIQSDFEHYISRRSLVVLNDKAFNTLPLFRIITDF